MDKYLEFVGATLAGVGFGLISLGFYGIGFILGLLSCCLLIPLFYEKNQYSLLTLQAYFAIMNLLGIYRIFGV